MTNITHILITEFIVNKFSKFIIFFQKEETETFSRKITINTNIHETNKINIFGLNIFSFINKCENFTIDIYKANNHWL